MKKFLAFATLASVALVGCVNDEKMEMTSGAQKISFDTPVMSTQTRAIFKGEIGDGENTPGLIAYPNNEQFVVYAKQHAGDIVAWENVASKYFWGTDKESITVGQTQETVDGSPAYTGKWEDVTKTEYYWPKDNTEEDYKLSFAAYSPAVLNTGATAAYGADGLTISGFAVDGTVANQYDLMYSGRILNCNYTNNATNGVQIKFNHALSSVVFAAVESDGANTYTINSIEIKGSFYTGGTFKENLEDGPTYEVADIARASWKDLTGNDVVTTYAPVLKKTSVGSESAEITYGTSALLTIPQAVPADAEVTIKYTVKADATGVVTDVNTVTKKLSEFKVGSSAPISQWNRSNRYVYLFKFGGTAKIFFKPVVTDWTLIDAGYVEI